VKPQQFTQQKQQQLQQRQVQHCQVPGTCNKSKEVSCKVDLSPAVQKACQQQQVKQQQFKQQIQQQQHCQEKH
jgi:hypothetical protein